MNHENFNSSLESTPLTFNSLLDASVSKSATDYLKQPEPEKAPREIMKPPTKVRPVLPVEKDEELTDLSKAKDRKEFIKELDLLFGPWTLNSTSDKISDKMDKIEEQVTTSLYEEPNFEEVKKWAFSQKKKI